MSFSIIAAEASFAVTDKLLIADPCQLQKAEPSYAAIVIERSTGSWEAETDATTEGWTNDKLELRRTDVADRRVTESEYPAKVGIDTGHVMAVGSEQLPVDFDAFCEEVEGLRGGADEIGGGVVCATGYGDGAYEIVVGRNADGEAVAVTITFIEPEETCWNCGETEDWCSCDDEEDE